MKTSSRLYIKSIIMLISLTSIPSFAITTYTVKSGDSLWRIASNHAITGIPNKDMIKAIKGINAKENPSINDDIVNIKLKLLIPSTKAEVVDGLKLYTLRHTQYLTQNHTQAPESNIPLAVKASKPINVSPAAETTAIQSLNTANSAATSSINFPSDQMSEHSTNNTGVIVPVVNSNKNTISSTQKANISTEIKSDHSKWLIPLFIAIVVLLIWRRRHKRKAQPQQHDTHSLKDQFYAKQMDLALESQTKAVKSSKPLQEKVIHKKKSKDELSQLLHKADELIETHDVTQAKSLLQEALNSDPKNLSIRLKILAVYGAHGDEISFNSERDYLASNLLPYDDKLWQEINALYNKYFGIN